MRQETAHCMEHRQVCIATEVGTVASAAKRRDTHCTCGSGNHVGQAVQTPASFERNLSAPDLGRTAACGLSHQRGGPCIIVHDTACDLLSELVFATCLTVSVGFLPEASFASTYVDGKGCRRLPDSWA
jgi:hypothetical protein